MQDRGGKEESKDTPVPGERRCADALKETRTNTIAKIWIHKRLVSRENIQIERESLEGVLDQ